MLSSHPFWTRRQALRLIAGAASSIGLHACTQSARITSASTPTDLTSASFAVTNWIGNSALYIAEEKNFFKDAGLDLSVRSFGTVAESFPAYSVGQLQGVAPVTSEVVSLAADEVNYRIVAVMDTSVGADAILARNSVSSIKDFKGRQVAVQKGGVGHFFLLQILASAGVKEEDVKIIDTTPEAGAAAYQAGDVEIAYTYAPYIEKAQTIQKDGRVIFDSSKMPTAIADLYTFSTDFIESNPEAVQGFVNGIFKSLDLMQTNPREALAIAAKRFEMQPDELATQLKGIRLPDLKTNQKMLGDPTSDLYMLKPMTAMAEFLKKHGQIQTMPDLSKFIDPQFVMALKSST